MSKLLLHAIGSIERSAGIAVVEAAPCDLWMRLEELVEELRVCAWSIEDKHSASVGRRGCKGHFVSDVRDKMIAIAPKKLNKLGEMLAEKLMIYTAMIAEDASKKDSAGRYCCIKLWDI